VARRLGRAVAPLVFGPPVAYVYNPLVYARAPHEAYLARWGAGRRDVLLVGMNPGPFGMAQTGVPFGDVAMVREFLGIEAPVQAPARMHPKRPVLGFACPRREVSGSRFWGWARERFGTARRFFAHCFVWNYCPLMFLAASGANITPDRLPAREAQPLEAACDEALRAVVQAHRPRTVLGIGRYAERRAAIALAGLPLCVAGMPHPSPANPAANRDWSELADRALAAAGLRP